MEQFLKNFFNDNSVCIGLCDLKRKTDEMKVSFSSQIQYQQPVQKTVQQPKPQKQTLAQKFAEQQKEYAAKQAYLEEQRRIYAEMQRKVQLMEQQNAQQRLVQQKAVYSQARTTANNVNSYRQAVAKQQAPQTRVIVNGNMKKVVSAAVPARY